jgi:uncharacterized membrane protein
MKSTAQVGGHPIHPMLIPYPFALLTTAAAFDVAARIRSRREWSQTAGHMTAVGLTMALVAALPGVIDYFGSVPRGTTAKRSATQHALTNLSALACFALVQSLRQRGGRLRGGALGAALLGTGLLSLGGWLGGQLVYHEHVGIDGAAPRQRLLPVDSHAMQPDTVRAAG